MTQTAATQRPVVLITAAKLAPEAVALLEGAGLTPVYTAAYPDMIARATDREVDRGSSLYPNAADGVDGVEAYLHEHLDEPGSFAGFLDGFGSSALLEQGRRARELTGR